MSPPPPPPAKSKGTPALIAGRYRLGPRLGKGAMAEVWEAHDVRLVRSVALKFLTVRGPGEDASATRRRFLREARLLASVRHPNVVQVIDFGGDPEDLPYMVMEILRGESLEERLERCAIELGELLQIMSEVLSGLGAVHEAGIVHRDLKPANLFLLDRAHAPRVKLIDFGVSKSNGFDHRSALATVEGQLIGTPAYMAPEQARGWQDVDGRADLYSLGTILYESVTGRLPFEDEATEDLIVSIVGGGAPAVATLRPEVGRELSDVIGRAMSLDRDDRYATADAMRCALLEAGAGIGLEPRSGPAIFAPSHRVPVLHTLASQRGARLGYEMTRSDRALLALRRPRSRWLVGASAVAMLGMAGGGAGLWADTGASPARAAVAPKTAVTGPPTPGPGEAMRADAGPPARVVVVLERIEAGLDEPAPIVEVAGVAAPAAGAARPPRARRGRAHRGRAALIAEPPPAVAPAAPRARRSRPPRFVYRYPDF